MLMVDFFRLRRWSQEELAERLMIGGAVNFNFAWSPGRRGVFYVTAHYGSFEVLAAVSRVLGLKATLVATPMKNRFVNTKMIFQRGGGDSGLNIVPHRGIVHKLIDVLKAGGQAAVLADQRGDDTRPVWVTFFGRQVLANGVFARFAMDGDSYCYPVMGIRLDDGRYYCEFGEEIPIQITGDTDHDVRVNCQRFHDVFEKWLRERPEQGFWMHSKFKRRSGKRKKIAPAFQPTHVRHE